METKKISTPEQISQSWTAKERAKRKKMAAAKQLQLRQLVFLAAISQGRVEATRESELQVCNAC